jgi:hypothetical protein
LPAQSQEPIPRVRATHDVLPSEIAVKAQILSQSYCHTDLEVYSVQMSVKLGFTNVSDHNVILSRRIESPAIVRVAKTIDDAQKGNFEFNPDFHYYVAELPNSPRFAKSPDPKYFVILTPKQTYELVVTSGALGAVEKGFAKKHGLLAKGDHVLQIDVDTWPYAWPHFRPSADNHELAERWRAAGRLVTGMVFSDFVHFTIPGEFNNPPCKP